MAKENVTVHGVDLNEYALGIAKNILPSANFKKGDITKLPFGDSTIDFVFTHGLMNYLDDTTVELGIREMHRVASRFIMNCERFDQTEKPVDEHCKFRDMQSKWLNYKVKIVSNVDMHEDIEPDKPRVTSESLCNWFSEQVLFNILTECGSSQIFHCCSCAPAYMFVTFVHERLNL